MRLGAWLRETRERTRIPRIDLELLAAHALGRSRSWVLAHGADEVDPRLLEPWVARRLAREPVAKIVGWREFYGRRFRVDGPVLIPRQETETLVEAALAEPGTASRVLDLGTGSGCVAITLALERPEWSLVASDVLPGALEVAERNAQALGAPVRLVLADGLRPFATRSFDLVVTNPPYVAAGDPLPDEIRLFEPAVALFAGADGLDFFRRLAHEGARVLRAGGLLLTEIGDGQEEAVAALFRARGWRATRRYRDLGGTVRVLGFEPGGP